MIIELEGYLIRPDDVSCVTPMVETLGPHAPNKRHYFRVYFRGGGQIALCEEASREELAQAVKCIADQRPLSNLSLKSALATGEFENRVQIVVTCMIKDAAS